MHHYPSIPDKVSKLGLKKTWVYDSIPDPDIVEELYGGPCPPLSPRSLECFSTRQAELEEYSISGSGDMDSNTFDEWPRVSVAAQFHALVPPKTRKKAHVKKRRAASLGNVDLPSEMERTNGTEGQTSRKPDTAVLKPETKLKVVRETPQKLTEPAEPEISIKTVDDLKRYLVRIGKLDPKELGPPAPALPELDSSTDPSSSRGQGSPKPTVLPVNGVN